MRQPTRLTSFLTPVDAEMARIALERADIPARVLDDSAFGESITGFLVMVESEDVDAAKDVLADIQRIPRTGQEHPMTRRARRVFRVGLILIVLANVFALASVYLRLR